MSHSAQSRQRLGRPKGKYESPDVVLLVSDESEVEPETRIIKREPSIHFMGGGGVPKRDGCGVKSTPIVLHGSGDRDAPIDVDDGEFELTPGNGGDNHPSELQDVLAGLGRVVTTATPPLQKRPILEGQMDGPCRKKRRVSDAPMSNSAPSSSKAKRKQASQTPEPDISRFHDGDGIHGIPPSPEQALRRKKRRKEKGKNSGSEDEYDIIHQGLVPHDTANWHPLTLRETIPPNEILDAVPDVDDLPQIVKRLSLSTGRRSTAPYQKSESDRAKGPYIWSDINAAHLLHAPRHSRRQVATMTRSQYDVKYYNPFKHLNPVATFRQAPGAINKIVQAPNMIAICSAAVGGNPDDDDPEPNPYNKGGSLILWRNGRVYTGEGHQATRNRRPDGAVNGRLQYQKHYSVNDVQIDPHDSTRLISSGNDCTVRVWQFEERETTDSSTTAIHLTDICKIGAVPHDLSYKPAASAFAVACGDGNIYLYSDYHSFDRFFTLRVGPKGNHHSAGAMVWGANSTSHFIFASSEPHDDGVEGCHRAFDTNNGDLAYNLDATEAGDAMAISTDGDRLALCTNGGSGLHMLRIYDIRTHQPAATQATVLEPFLTTGSSEVNCASFSPDGLYLAIGRSDDCVHVYDSRMFDRGPLLPFQHRGSPRNSPGNGPFGIVEVKWATIWNKRLGIVSGGTDGCVRLWDVRKSSDSQDNGTVIAETEYDIGHFCVGDTFNDEKSLVVGDGGGGISIFDEKNSGW